MIKPDGYDADARSQGIANQLLDVIEQWYEDKRNGKGVVDSNVMCAGLYITEFLAGGFPITRQMYAARTQVKGASGLKAKAILADHGQLQKFTREGGRTSRQTIVHAEELVEIVNESGPTAEIAGSTDSERQVVAWTLQSWFVKRVRDDYFGRQKISADIDASWAIAAVISNLIATAEERSGNAAGALIQHLVGADLQIRFPDEDINIESYTTADQQTRRAGDYQIGQTAIHVTMSPGAELFHGRCKDNLRHGFRPRVLVPRSEIRRAVVHAEDAGIMNQVAIQSVEDFIGTDIEEVAHFSQIQVRIELRRLLEIYNSRIEKAESDLSLKVEIPEHL